MHGPFAQYILLLNKNCPVAFINDVRGSKAQPNIVIEQREKLALLGHTERTVAHFVPGSRIARYRA
jgi:hypothetical protein